MSPRYIEPESRPEYKGSKTLSLVFVVLAILTLAVTLPLIALAADPPAPPVTGPYVLIGWNDLGMHCSNKSFADLAVLPPFNNAWSVLIHRGSATTWPEVVGGAGYGVTYAIQGNTYSIGKTDFWSYDQQLFGVDLPPNVGLTGNGLTGSMAWSGDHFVATGIPITPYDDADLVHEQPYQLANLKAYDGANNLLAETQIVTPVSNEMTCNACHHPLAGETVEHAILRKHDNEEGTNLQNSRPVLCASCHASNALGLPGNPNLPSLSQAMHNRHAEETNDCYKCHPGPSTRCLRDVMNTQYGVTCIDCHGNTLQVASSIEHNGRRPWLDEPRCETCHGSNYAESPATLYRNSHNGHGGLFCPTCHNSPHAILPSREERDNRQTTALQGHSGTLRECVVCHGYTPTGPGPHGYVVPASVPVPGIADAASVVTAPNPMRESTEIHYRVLDTQPIHLSIVDASGREVRVLTANSQTPGEHTLVWDGRTADGLEAASGVYFAKLKTAGQAVSARLVKVGR